MTRPKPQPDPTTVDPRELYEQALDLLEEIKSTCDVLMCLSNRSPNDRQVVEMNAGSLCILSSRLYDCSMRAMTHLKPVGNVVYGRELAPQYVQTHA